MGGGENASPEGMGHDGNDEVRRGNLAGGHRTGQEKSPFRKNHFELPGRLGHIHFTT